MPAEKINKRVVKQNATTRVEASLSATYLRDATIRYGLMYAGPTTKTKGLAPIIKPIRTNEILIALPQTFHFGSRDWGFRPAVITSGPALLGSKVAHFITKPPPVYPRVRGVKKHSVTPSFCDAARVVLNRETRTLRRWVFRGRFKTYKFPLAALLYLTAEARRPERAGARALSPPSRCAGPAPSPFAPPAQRDTVFLLLRF
ncbi:hypothetical protein EVAR_79290_1 [Eumeta japonica]|uniref:Uncharacterized protein n=1 Tax=Eumeta variegata TaxID=151549 RepID=A0A4C1TFM4_EUMVA|nr:hypothetical protein EVAR_79290_1 [Eumeta japonica]